MSTFSISNFNIKRKNTNDGNDDKKIRNLEKTNNDDFEDFVNIETHDTSCKTLKELLQPLDDITDEQIIKLTENTDMTELISKIMSLSDELQESQESQESQNTNRTEASVNSTTVTISDTYTPLEANIQNEFQNPNFLRDGSFNMDEYIKKLNELSGVNFYQSQRGGKRRNNRYKLRHNTTMKKRKIIKGGYGDVRVWICGHKEFVAWVMMMSCLGGGYWCLATFIIPIAVSELNTVIWNYIIKICETTAVVITNLFKTNGGLSKFIDLLIGAYKNKAIIGSVVDDMNIKIIKPFFDLIVSAITWGCKTTAPGSAAPGAPLAPAAPAAPPANIYDALTDDLRKRLNDALVRIAELETEALQKIENVEAYKPIIDELKTAADPLIKMIENDIEPLVNKNFDAINKAMEEESKGEQESKGGENIISYLAKKIKKTMKRRKRSHKKYVKKNLHYKSHKKNKR
jgi:hypothetical protein